MPASPLPRLVSLSAAEVTRLELVVADPNAFQRVCFHVEVPMERHVPERRRVARGVAPDGAAGCGHACGYLSQYRRFHE